MGFIDHQEAAVFLLDPDEIGHGGDIAVHAVGAFNDNQHLLIIGALALQNGFQRSRITVGEGPGGCLTEPAALLYGVVRQGVIQNQVVFSAEISDEGYIGGMTAHADNGILCMLPVRQFPFQLPVNLLFPGEQTAAAGAGAIFVNGGFRGFLNFLPAAHAHIVIAAEFQNFLAVHNAGVQQGRLMTDKIGVVTFADQRFLTLQEGAVFRTVLKAGHRQHRHPFLRMIFLRSGEKAFNRAGHAKNRGALPVFLRRNCDAPGFLRLQGHAQHLEAVTVQILNEIGGIGYFVLRYIQSFRIEGADLLADFLPGAFGTGRLRHGSNLRSGALRMQIQLAVNQLALGIQALQLNTLHLDAADQRQGHRRDQGAVQLGGQRLAGIDGGHTGGQIIQIIGIAVTIPDVQQEDNILVPVPFISAQTQNCELLHAGQTGPGVLQIIRIDVFTGFVDNDILQPSADINPAGAVHSDNIAGRIPAAFQRVGRQDFPADDPAGMDAASADLQLSSGGIGTVRHNPVLRRIQGLAHGSAEAVLQTHGGFKTGDGGFRHAVSGNRVITKRVQRSERFLRGVAPAEDDAFHLSAQQFPVDGSKHTVHRKTQGGFRRDPLHKQGAFHKRAEQEPFSRLFLFQVFLQRLDQTVSDQRDHDHQLRLEMPAGFHNGGRRTVRQEQVGHTHGTAPDDVRHEAQHVMEGKESQETAVFIADDPLVLLVDLRGVQRLLTQRAAGIGKDTAAARGSAGAHGHIFTPDRVVTDGARRLHNGPEIDLTAASGQGAGLLCDNHTAAGLVQQPLQNSIGSGGVQQQDMMAGTDNAPEQPGPFHTGIHCQRQPSLIGDKGTEAGSVVIRPPGHFGKGQGAFLTALEPSRSRNIPIASENLKECRQRRICL